MTATITSPPYGALKDYGHADQIGYGHSYERYLEEMRDIFEQVRRYTQRGGALWLIADTYVERESQSLRRLVPVPFDLSRIAEDAGWTLRDVIIWRKDRTLPWSNGTRLRNAFEYVLFLANGGEPKYHLDRLRNHKDHKEWFARFPERYHPDGQAPANVWDIPIPQQGSWGTGEITHACPLPPELVRRLVLLSSDKGDVIFDPFAGSGVVIAEADALGRKALGCEIVERHIDEYERIVKPEIQRLNRGDDRNGHDEIASRRVIFDLRSLKFARVVMQHVAKRRGEIAWPAAAIVIRGSQQSASKGRPRPRIIFVVEGNRDARKSYLDLAKVVSSVAPASKFGLEPVLETVSSRNLKVVVRGYRLYLYRLGRTTRATGAVKHSALKGMIKESAEDSIPPILSNIHVDIPPRSDSSVLSTQA